MKIKNVSLLSLSCFISLANLCASGMPLAEDTAPVATVIKEETRIEAKVEKTDPSDEIIKETLSVLTEKTVVQAIEEKKEETASATAAEIIEEPAMPQAEIEAQTNNPVLVDKILVRVNGSNILMSDLKKPQITKSGEPYSLSELIDEKLLIEHAQKRGFTVNDEIVNRQIAAVKSEHGLQGMTDLQFEEELKKQGFTIKEYRNQLAINHLTQSVISAEVSEKIIVSAQEVEQYYTENPSYTKDQYKIVICTIPADQLEQSATFAANKDSHWESLGWIESKDLGEQFETIKDLKKDQISAPVKAADGSMFVFKYTEHRESRLKTLAERYSAIERQLQSERKGSIVTNFLKELNEQATIEHLA